MPFVALKLRYGHEGRFQCRLARDRLVHWHKAPYVNRLYRDDLRAALASPLEFPALAQAVVPGDRVVLVLDRRTPRGAGLIAEVWDVLHARGIAPESVTILQPADWHDAAAIDPRSELPKRVQGKVRWVVHDPTTAGACRYLASAAASERIYLSRELVDADFVITIGPLTYDTVLGYRGAGSALYPGLSTTDAIRKAHGQGHDELEPDDSRPLRQLIDEVVWLLGLQFSIQVIPSERGGISQIFCGQPDAVFHRGRTALADRWRVEVTEHPEVVLAAVDVDAAGHGWPQIAAALDVARRIVAKNGRIVILSELDLEPSAGIRSIAESRVPRDALKSLREAAPPDLVEATQLARAVDRANVYLLSKLPDQTVEDLFMIPLRASDEVQRLLAGTERCLVLSSAQHTYSHFTGAAVEI